jgi:hypothetical protein
VHFSDYYRCLGFGLFIMLSLGKLAQIFILSQTFHLLVFTFVIGLSAFFLCLKWAPAENPNKILTDEEKEKFRVLSVIFTVVWMGIIHVFVVYSQGRFNSLVMASAMGIWVQSLTLTPQAYKAVGYINMLLDFLRKGGAEYVEKMVVQLPGNSPGSCSQSGCTACQPIYLLPTQDAEGFTKILKEKPYGCKSCDRRR